MLLGSDDFPKSREELLGVLNFYKDEEGKSGLSTTKATQEQFAFLQQVGGNKQKTRDGPRTNSNARSCFSHCKKMDHLAYQCPDLTIDEHADLKAAYDKEKQQHGNVHAEVVVVVEGRVFMLANGYIKAFKVTRKQSLKTNRIYLDIL